MFSSGELAPLANAGAYHALARSLAFEAGASRGAPLARDDADVGPTGRFSDSPGRAAASAARIPPHRVRFGVHGPGRPGPYSVIAPADNPRHHPPLGRARGESLGIPLSRILPSRSRSFPSVVSGRVMTSCRNWRVSRSSDSSLKTDGANPTALRARPEKNAHPRPVAEDRGTPLPARADPAVRDRPVVRVDR